MFEEDDSEREWERDRQAIASLLEARNEDVAAAIVAASSYCCVNVGGFDDPSSYQVTLSVPPRLFDLADTQFRDVLDRACADIVGRETYWRLSLTVRRPPYETDWEARIIDALDKRWVPSERVDVPAIEASPH